MNSALHTYGPILASTVLDGVGCQDNVSPAHMLRSYITGVHPVPEDEKMMVKHCQHWRREKAKSAIMCKYAIFNCTLWPELPLLVTLHFYLKAFGSA